VFGVVLKKAGMLVPDGCTSRRTLKTGDYSGQYCKNDEGIGNVLCGERFRAQPA